MRWLPVNGGETEDTDVYPPWVPQTLAGFINVDELKDRWNYMAVDEIVGDRVGLSIARWPGVDDQGRLRFGDSSEDELLGVPYESFTDAINSHRVVMVMTPTGELNPETADALRERDVRIGDVFAIPREVTAELVSQMEEGGGQLEIPDAVRIYDISYEAREQAKLAAAAAVAPPLDYEEARYFLGEEGPGGDATEEDGPDDEGPGGSQPPEPPKPVGRGPGGEMVSAEQVAELGV